MPKPSQPDMARRSFTLAATSSILLAASSRDAVRASPSQSAPVRRGYTDGPHGQIHFRYAGDRGSAVTPLMCLHASPLSSIVYETWLGEMGKDRFCVAPDTPGYGGSDTPSEALLIPDFADAMIYFMDEVGLGTVDVMGYHTGSMTSTDLAMRYPDRIRRVVLISAPNYTDEERTARQSRVSRPAPSYEQTLESALTNYRSSGKGMFRDMPDELFFDLTIERMRHYRTSNWGFRAAYSYDIGDTLTKVKQPVLLLNPEDDVWETTPRVEPLIQNGRMVNLPGWSHGAMDVHTQEMAAIVRAFLV